MREWTPEAEAEAEEFLATLARLRDEDNRYHGVGKYAPEDDDDPQPDVFARPNHTTGD